MSDWLVRCVCAMERWIAWTDIDNFMYSQLQSLDGSKLGVPRGARYAKGHARPAEEVEEEERRRAEVASSTLAGPLRQ